MIMAKKKKPLTDEEIIIISKSEQKRDSKELQELAQIIAGFNVTQRKTLPLNEEIEAGLRLADKIKGKHDAFARNIRFISKQLADIDIDALKFAIEKIKNRHAFELVKNAKLEEIRDNVIAQGNDAIEELLSENSALERQRLRQLVRQAGKEVKLEKPGKSFKELFSYLKASIKFEY